MIAICYVSRATRELGVEEVEHLLLRARARNAEHGVTGVLLHRKGRFLQYIEGPAAGMGLVYGIIQADPQHADLRELINEPIAARECGAWSMAYLASGLLAYVGTSADMKMLGTGTGTGTGEHMPRMSRAHALLNAFWNDRLEG